MVTEAEISLIRSFSHVTVTPTFQSACLVGRKTGARSRGVHGPVAADVSRRTFPGMPADNSADSRLRLPYPRLAVDDPTAPQRRFSTRPVSPLGKRRYQSVLRLPGFPLRPVRLSDRAAGSNSENP